MNQYIEQNCCIELEGQKFCAGGAVVTNQYIVAYIGKLLPDGRRKLTDWHGNIIGTCNFSSTWKINSWVSNFMHQVYATVGGVTYTGRSAGEGMIFKGKRVAKQ